MVRLPTTKIYSALNLNAPKQHVKCCFDIHTSFWARAYTKLGNVLRVILTLISRKIHNFSMFTHLGIFVEKTSWFRLFLLYPLQSIRIGIDLAPKGPQVKSTEPMNLNKFTNYSIRSGWILSACVSFFKKYMGSCSEA